MSFTLTFPAGPLGLTIAPAETTGHPSVVVKTVKPGCAHGARLRAGDELVAVGATSVRELCESATMDAATGNCTVTFTNSAYPSTANAVCLRVA